MTAHHHTTRMTGCYRCELNVDESLSSMSQELEEIKRDIYLFREHVLGTLADASDSGSATLPGMRLAAEYLEIFLGEWVEDEDD